ncbi:MAG: RNA polymerase sigma factor [Balneolaceae bacterium]
MNFESSGELWKRFISGDTVSFCEIFKTYYKGMYGYGLKLCNNPNLTEDCIQELFVSIWERRDNLHHITSPNVYLFVSLRRNILKMQREQIRKKNLLDDEANGSFNIHFGAEELIIRHELKNEQKEELQRALNQLSNRQKEVIYLHFYNGMSYHEIEEILSINRQSVRNLMYRAMESLRTVLDLETMRLVI